MLTKSDFQSIESIFAKKIKIDIEPLLEKKLKPIKEDISKIRKSQNEIIAFFDEEYLSLRKRVDRIESHLNLSPL